MKAPASCLTLNRWIHYLLLLLPLSFCLPAFGADEDEFSQAELDQLLAPVALYPDTVLSHILIAATYPLEVVEAARWSKRHPNMSGETAVNAVDDQDWDPSVKALVAFPQILERMDEDLDWTQRLGDAFLSQEKDVVSTVQGLRERAYRAGNLKSSEHMHVVRDADTIIIEPAVREVVYIPWYDPHMIYGPWWWPAYPPFYWAYWDGWGYPYHSGAYIGFFWGIGFHLSTSFYFSNFYWPHHQVVVVNYRHQYFHRYKPGRDVIVYHNAQHWSHDYHHRRNVIYRNDSLNRQFYGPNTRHINSGARGDRPAVISPGRDRHQSPIINFGKPAPGAVKMDNGDVRVRREGRENGNRGDSIRNDSGGILHNTERRDSGVRVVPGSNDRRNGDGGTRSRDRTNDRTNDGRSHSDSSRQFTPDNRSNGIQRTPAARGDSRSNSSGSSRNYGPRRDMRSQPGQPGQGGFHRSDGAGQKGTNSQQGGLHKQF